VAHEGAGVGAGAKPGVCRVTAVTTHPPARDTVTIWVAIPTKDWNGRFLGTGGGGFVGGSARGVNQLVYLGCRRANRRFSFGVPSPASDSSC
jgi:hypothetical protein